MTSHRVWNTWTDRRYPRRTCAVLFQPERRFAGGRLGPRARRAAADRLGHALHRRPRHAVRHLRRAIDLIRGLRPSLGDARVPRGVDGHRRRADVAPEAGEVAPELANLPFPLRPRARAHLVQALPAAAVVVQRDRLRHGEQVCAVELVVEVLRELLLGVDGSIQNLERPLPLSHRLLDDGGGRVRDARAVDVRAPPVLPAELELAF